MLGLIAALSALGSCRSDPVSTNVDALIGRIGVVTEDGKSPASPARIKIGSEEWRAMTEDHAPLREGTRVTVTGMEGNTLTVRQLPGE